MSDPNNLLVKYGIKIKGAEKPVEVEFLKKRNLVALMFTGIHTPDALRTAAHELNEALPERLNRTLLYTVKNSDLALLMPVGTYEELTGQKFDRGKGVEV